MAPRSMTVSASQGIADDIEHCGQLWGKLDVRNSIDIAVG